MTSWLLSWLAASVRRVAPESMVRFPAIAAVLADLLRTKVPVVTVDAPLKVLPLLPPRVRVPVPDLLIPPDPEIKPLNSRVPPEVVSTVIPRFKVTEPEFVFTPLVFREPSVVVPPAL